MTGRWRAAVLCALLTLAGCAAPALVEYTLAPQAADTTDVPLGNKVTVIAVSRALLPDSLDTENITFRDGSVLRRSHGARWATRLSLGITDRLTDRLAARWPQALVTARPLNETPTDRLLVNISRLDVDATGIATLESDWMIVPGDARQPVRRDRARFTLPGSVATDQDIVNLMGQLVDKLAAAIDVGPVP